MVLLFQEYIAINSIKYLWKENQYNATHQALVKTL